MENIDNSLIVVIVDDDYIYKFTALSELDEAGVAKKVHVFSDGEEALEFLNATLSNPEHLPDVIFLDINMPIMDGWEFLEEYIKLKPRLGKKIVIYLVTSSDFIGDIERAKKISEVSDYIIKPITAEQFKGLAKQILNAKNG